MRGVYAITNVLSDVVYYGQATQMHVRLGQHKSDLSHGRHRNPHLQASWNKYGADAFVFAAQYVIPDGDMTAREKFCIDGAYGLGLRLFNMRVAEPGSMAGY